MTIPFAFCKDYIGEQNRIIAINYKYIAVAPATAAADDSDNGDGGNNDEDDDDIAADECLLGVDGDDNSDSLVWLK